MEYNLTLIFPNKSREDKEIIKFRSTQLFIINILILVNEAFFTNKFNIIQNYYNIKIPFDFDRNNKIILLSPHYGIYTDNISFNHFVKKKISAIVRKLNYTILNNFIYKNTKFVSYYFIKEIKHNNKINEEDIIYILCDQKGTINNKKIIFLNQETSFHYGPAYMHNKEKRIIIIFCTYNFILKKITYKFHKPSISVDDSILDITQKIADIFSKEILENPEQYFWMHDRFKSNLK